MYRQAESNVKELKRMGATVVHGVDVKTMKRHVDLKFNRFHRIIFNFPHAGFIGEETQAHMIRYAYPPAVSFSSQVIVIYVPYC